MLAGTVRQDDQPPVLPTAKLPTGALAGLSSTTSTRPLTPPAAPEATRASNCVEPVPKLTPLYFRYSPLVSWAALVRVHPAGVGVRGGGDVDRALAGAEAVGGDVRRRRGRARLAATATASSSPAAAGGGGGVDGDVTDAHGGTR